MDADNGSGLPLNSLPCVKRLNQLYYTSPCDSFPKKAIETFIDDNKALLRRMYGELQEPGGSPRLRSGLSGHSSKTGKGAQ